MSFNKILVIRLSSIGDIVLTSPVLRSIKNQTNAKIDYLTKEKYLHVIKNNPYIENIFTIKDVIGGFESTNYDLIIDLQKNFKSLFLSLLLKKINTKYVSYNKKNIKKWLLVNCKKKFIVKEHLVDRYFSRLRKYNILNDNKGLDYIIPSSINKNSFPKKLPFDKTFIVWVLGGTYKYKKLSKSHIKNVCSQISAPIVFLGGELEKVTGDKICNDLHKSNIYNLCGVLSLDESAYVLQNASIVLTNDTGLMHIAAAFKKIIISFWGCTKPSLGMYPYKSHPKSVQLVTKSSVFPCSKLGNKCRQDEKGCINNISSEDILTAIKRVGCNLKG